MKYLLSVLAIFYFFNSGFTQQNSSFDSAKNFQIELQNSFSNSDFISQPLEISANSDAAFYTLAVFVDAPFSGQLAYQMEGKDWQSLDRYHEATHPSREIFELIFLSNQATTITFKSDQALQNKLTVRWLSLAPTNQLNNTQSTIHEDCDCPQPDFCGRSCWCPAGNCPTDATPVATVPSHIIVHHTASASTSDDFPAVVRSYWDFHVNVNGWDDLGYNWLIDGEGVIYEGRGDGTQGAHFSCMNAQTTGIAMIGNFEESTPTSAAISSLEELISWEACDKMILPAASSNHITSGALLSHISGHRDGNDLPNSCTNTVCPGENLYPLLPEIRERVTNQACLNDLVATQDINQNLFQIFPNPSNGHFQISGDLNQIASLKIYSQNGQLINFHFHQNGILELDQTGFYILKVIRKDGFFSAHKLLVSAIN